MLVGAFANPGERFCEGEHPVVLDRIPHLAPATVVAILLAAARVTTGRLEMAAGVGADPDVRPGRGDGEALDPASRFPIADGAAISRHVGEGPSGSLPPEA